MRTEKLPGSEGLRAVFCGSDDQTAHLETKISQAGGRVVHKNLRGVQTEQRASGTESSSPGKTQGR